jgi:D-alanyl-D-alanine carboxypeptidase
VRSLAIAACTLVLVVACGTPRASNDVTQRLQALLDTTIGPDGIHSTVLLVEDPTRNLHFAGAAGMADPQSSRHMTTADRFRTASVTKMMTAALVLKLVEQGQLQLDAPLERYFTRDLLLSLHVYGGHAYGPELTVRQLLGHTTGLPDYFFDGDQNRDGTSDFVESILANPTRQWDPADLVRYTIEHQSPLFAPGQGYHYADTNYVILGLLIETVTGQPLHDVYRKLLFDPLGMVDTYLEWHEPGTPWPPLSHVYLGGRDITAVNTSADWAGGGLVSTVEDLRRFMDAFVAGRVVTPASRDEMQRWSSQSEGSYGLGMIHVTVGGATFVGHAGYYGVLMLYWPERQAIVCATVNQSTGHPEHLLEGVVKILASP